MASPTLYDDVVHVTSEYLGPAADRFVTRQIRSHLQKKPEQLKQSDLRELIDWIKLAMALLTSDDLLINEYIANLEALTGASKRLPANASGAK